MLGKILSVRDSNYCAVLLVARGVGLCCTVAFAQTLSDLTWGAFESPSRLTTLLDAIGRSGGMLARHV